MTNELLIALLQTLPPTADVSVDICGTIEPVSNAYTDADSGAVIIELED